MNKKFDCMNKNIEPSLLTYKVPLKGNLIIPFTLI